MRILFVIAARGGSKGIPKKNIMILGKLPLIAYKINTAKKCIYDKRIIVSTDDLEIAKVAEQYGAEVPFIRPDFLATDTASSIDVVLHTISWIEKNDVQKYDYICLLEPSSPFLTPNELNQAISQISKGDADTMLGMRKVEVNSRLVKPLDSDGKLSFFYDEMKTCKSVRRQDFQEEYTMNGCLYIARYNYFKQNQSFHSENSLPFIMSAEKSIEIDEVNDLRYAQFLLENKIISMDEWL